MTPELEDFDNIPISDEEFQDAYKELLNNLTVHDLVSLPDIPVIVKEEYNDDIIRIAYANRSFPPCNICKKPSDGIYDKKYWCEDCFYEAYPEDDE